MTTGKIITGVAVGTLVALILIPKTRKLIADALGNLTDTIKGFASEAEELSERAEDVAGAVKATGRAIA